LVFELALWSCTHIPNIIDLSGKQKSYGPDKLRGEEAEEEEEEAEAEEEKIRLKQYVSLRSKGRHNNTVCKDTFMSNLCEKPLNNNDSVLNLNLKTKSIVLFTVTYIF
jgi:hypothetical protein